MKLGRLVPAIADCDRSIDLDPANHWAAGTSRAIEAPKSRRHGLVFGRIAAPGAGSLEIRPVVVQTRARASGPDQVIEEREFVPGPDGFFLWQNARMIDGSTFAIGDFRIFFEGVELDPLDMRIIGQDTVPVAVSAKAHTDRVLDLGTHTFAWDRRAGLAHHVDGAGTWRAVPEVDAMFADDAFAKWRPFYTRAIRAAAAERARLVASTPTALAPSDPVASQPGKTASAAAGSGPFLHLASFRTEDAARNGREELTRSFASLLSDLRLEIRRVDLGKDGIYFRVLAGPLRDASTARDRCQRLQNSGAYCQVQAGEGG
jgi:hypothetical protein